MNAHFTSRAFNKDHRCCKYNILTSRHYLEYKFNAKYEVTVYDKIKPI